MEIIEILLSAVFWLLAWLLALSIVGWLAFCVISGVGGILLGMWEHARGEPDSLFGTTSVWGFISCSIVWLSIMAALLYIIFDGIIFA